MVIIPEILCLVLPEILVSILSASMGTREIERWTERDNACRINFGVRHIIMALDMIKAHGLGDSRLLIQVHQVALQVRIIDDAADVTLEMAVINDVEPNECAEETPVRFHHTDAE